MHTERSRAWRRTQRARIIFSRLHGKLGHRHPRASGYFAKQHGLPWYVPWWSRGQEKKWSRLYLRSRKLARARQLGLPYPRRSWGRVTQAEHDGERDRLRVLFVCSKNKWRSPTAERMWRHDARIAVRSAGTSASAARVISPDDIAWADLVLVMEHKHAQRIRSLFASPGGPRMVVLDIPDEHRFMSPELVEMLRCAVEPVLEEMLARGGGR